MITRALASALLVLVASCSELPPINEGVCGNGILEPREDCDNPTALCSQCALKCADLLQCPSGFVCARDGLCHAPGGEFEDTARVMAPFPVLGFRIVDIDFDGYGDVIGLNPTALTMRYGSDDGQLPRSHAMVMPQVLGFPAMTNLGDPFVTDVVLPTADGLVAYTGALGVPSPRQFPLGRLEFLGGRPEPFDAAPVDDTIALVGNTIGASPTVAFSMLVLTSEGPRYDAEVTELCGRQVSATQLTWVQRMIAAYKTADASFVALTTPQHTCVLRIRRVPEGAERKADTSCPPSGGAARCRYEIQSLTGPTLGPFVRPPVLADLDGDGCPSLIDHDAGLGALREYEGLANGAGGCSIAALPTPLPELVDMGPFAELIGSVPLVPPIAGMRADALISSYAIHGLHADGPRRLYVSDRPLTRAAVGDLDRDGAVDVVLSSRFPNLDVARRVPTAEAFLLVRTTTVGPVMQTVVGDFDGDQRDDLAYVEDLGPRQRLSIAYGTPSGLTPGVPAGLFSHVEFMATMQVRDSNDPFELVDDLVVIDLVGTFPDVEPEITVLHGSPSRTMLSFYGPPVPIPDTAFRAVVAGDFFDADGSAGFPDLVALQTHPTNTAIWLIPGFGGGRLGDPVTVDMGTELPRTQLFGTCRASESTYELCLDHAKFVAWPAVVDTDPADGVDSSHDIVLGLDQRTDRDGVAGQPRMVRFDPAALISTSTSTSTSIAIEPMFSAGGLILALEVIDVDQDGMPELVAAFAESSLLRQDGYTMICRMNRDGTTRSCTNVRDILGVGPEVECVDAVLGTVRPLCSGEADRQQLTVLCRHVRERKGGELLFESNVYPIVAGDGADGFMALPPLLTVPTRLDQIRLGDVTGDAVDDLVALDIASGARVLHVYRQKTTREVDACSAD